MSELRDGPERLDGGSGRVLGDFRILREIGRGGMGTVYEAEQLSLGRRVALKILPRALSMSQEAIQRFHREAHAAGRLQLPGVVAVHGVGSDGDSHYLAMELVQGAPLDVILESVSGKPRDVLTGSDVHRAVSGHLRLLSLTDVPASVDDESEALRAAETPAWSSNYLRTMVAIAAQVADALEGIHQAGIIHRDVKPANIMVRPDGSAVLTDFGLARDVEIASLTMTGTIGGTPHYLSPEQISAKHFKLDHRTDIFSLGATLYELVTFCKAFVGDSISAIANQVLSREPLDPRKLNPKVDRDLAAVIARALEKNPDQRYMSAGDFANDLHNWLDGIEVEARPVSKLTRFGRWSRREPRLAAALLVTLVSLTLGLIVSLGFYSTAKASALAAQKSERQARASEREALDEKARAEAARKEAETKEREAQRLRIQASESLAAEREALDAAKRALAKMMAAQKAERAAKADAKLASEERETALDQKKQAERVATAKTAELERAREAKKRADAERAALQRNQRLWSFFGDPWTLGRLEELKRVGEEQLIPLREKRLNAIDTWLSRAGELVTRWREACKGMSAEQVAEVRAATGEQQPAALTTWQELDKLLDDSVETAAMPYRTVSIEGMGRRKRLIEETHQRTIKSSAAVALWTEARKEAKSRFQVDLAAQEGLLPIGRDPKSRLLEFVHVDSGTVPERKRGELVVTAETGIVFVLLPGGAVQLGAQSSRRRLPNYDPKAESHESPVRYLSLSPFLCAKHETTQAQWRRLTGQEPSSFRPGKGDSYGNFTDLHPVERVSWVECSRLSAVFGFDLPTEAQWEYACRGGKDTPWWTGRRAGSLMGRANLRDWSLRRVLDGKTGFAGWDDRWPAHAPVGTFRPNPFGLFDVHGNLAELCREPYSTYRGAKFRLGDGLRSSAAEAAVQAPSSYVCRGGSWEDEAIRMRASSRVAILGTARRSSVGVRFVRALDP